MKKTTNTIYPEYIDRDNWDGFKHFEEFDGSASYEEDYQNALKFQKQNGGELYTKIDDEGVYVCYVKGKSYCNRLGYTIIIKGGLKEDE